MRCHRPNQKGEFYSVSEMCVDGWYKGQSLRLGQSGVFPGNHVHPVDPGAKTVRYMLEWWFKIFYFEIKCFLLIKVEYVLVVFFQYLNFFNTNLQAEIGNLSQGSKTQVVQHKI